MVGPCDHLQHESKCSMDFGNHWVLCPASPILAGKSCLGHDICVQARKNIQQAKDQKLKENGNTKDTLAVKFKPLVKKKAKRKKSKEKFDNDWSVDEDYSDDGDVSPTLQNPKKKQCKDGDNV
ncbi:hypothetical protein Tco_0530948 [Tanacetum coccineum]